MCYLHLTHPRAHTWSSGQLTVQRPGSSRGPPAGAGIRTHNLGLPRVSSPTLYPLGHDCPTLVYIRYKIQDNFLLNINNYKIDNKQKHILGETNVYDFLPTTPTKYITQQVELKFKIVKIYLYLNLRMK